MIAVITGAGSGIGAALGKELARRGATIIGADIDATRVAEVCTAIRIAGGRAEHAVVDVTAALAVEQLAADVVARHGRIDLWINNAGIAVAGTAESIGLDDWRRVLDVNLAGVIHGVHAVYPRMIAQRAGHIVNMASVAGLAAYPLALPYTTSKHAVVGLSLALRAEAAAHGVRVSVACPGVIHTPIWERSTVRGTLAAGRGTLLELIPRAMSPERCATAIARGIAQNRAVIPVTAEARAAWWLARLSPSLAARVGHRIASYARKLSGASSTHRHREAGPRAAAR